MNDDSDEFFELDQLIRAYLGQDMELLAPTVPEALAYYARVNDDETKAALLRTLDRFLDRHADDVEDAFRRRYEYDFLPEELGQTVPEFFAMVRAVLAGP